MNIVGRDLQSVIQTAFDDTGVVADGRAMSCCCVCDDSGRRAVGVGTSAFCARDRGESMPEVGPAVDRLGESRPDAELDFVVDDRLTAVSAHDLWFHVVSACLVIEPYRGPAAIAKPLVPPGQHRRDHGELNPTIRLVDQAQIRRSLDPARREAEALSV